MERPPGLRRTAFRACGTGPRSEVRLLFADVLGLQSLRPLRNLELHAVAFGERAEPVHLDGGVVDEHVLAALLRDEAVPLAVVEPLHGTLRHVTTFFVADGSPALREPSWLTAVSSSKTARWSSNQVVGAPDGDRRRVSGGGSLLM